MLKNVRESKNISQSQLAKLSGVNVRMIQHYEQGRKNINGAHLNTLLDLSNALECSIIDILSDVNLIKKIKKSRFY